MTLLFVRHGESLANTLVGNAGAYRAICENISFEFIKTAQMPNTVVIETVWTPTGLVCISWGGASV